MRPHTEHPAATEQTRAPRLTRLLLVALTVLVCTGVAGPVHADEVDGGAGGYADFTFGGVGGAYTGTMTLGGGFPAASFTSTSRSGSVGVQTGASTFLNLATPPGAVYGLSRNREYLNLRPAADRPNAPSVTTYTFAAPTPSSGWAFVLGDVDADRLVISATDTDGNAVDAAGLGFESVFNYCGGTPSPCTRTTPPSLPVWDPGTLTLDGNATADDTNGAAAWFRPTVALSSLTFTFVQRSGLPVYQTWFANVTQDVTGTVTGCPAADGAPAGGVTVSLNDADGTTVATTETAADGTYAFTDYTAATYDVVVTAPDGCESDALTVPVDTTTGDDTADFTLTPIVDPTPDPTETPTTDEPTPTGTPTTDEPTPTETATTDEPTPAPSSSTAAGPSALASSSSAATVTQASGSSGGGDQVLPDTGAPTGLMATGIGGIALALVGALMVVASRSRRGRHS